MPNSCNFVEERHHCQPYIFNIRLLGIKTMKFKIILLGIVILGLFSAKLYAQIVTPSLDPAVATELSAAISWRFGSTIGVETTQFQKTDAVLRKTDGKTVKTEDNRSSALVAYQPTHTTIQLFMVPAEKDYDWDPSTDTYQSFQRAYNKASLTVRGKNIFSIGVGANNFTITKNSIINQVKSYGGSFSVRVFKGIFMGAGLEKVTETPGQLDPRKWDKQYSGIAFMYGDPLSYMFRTELSASSSKEVKTGPTEDEIHPKTSYTNIAAEALLKGYLLTYQKTLESVFAYNEQGDDKKRDMTRYGIGMRGSNLSYGFYFSEGEESINTMSRPIQKYQLTFGFSFI